MNSNQFFRSALALASTALLTVSALPSSASTNHTFTGGAFDSVVSTTNTWSVGIGGSLGGQRMLINMGGTNTVTITVQGTQGGNAVDMSGAECSWEQNSTVTTLVLGGNTSATLTSNASAGSVDCTLTRQTIIGSQFFVRVPGSPTRVSGEIRFYLDNYGSSGSSQAPRRAVAPIKYSGPEFSELALKPALAGAITTLDGRKLDQISSIAIDGKVAKLSDATDKSLKLELPAGLAPGVYDLVVTTANHGKLTHMNAIRIREVLPPASLTIQGTGVLSGEEFKKLTAFSRTQNPDMNAVTCIVNSNSEGKSFMQARALCDRIAATNLNVKTTMFETRSTVKSSAIFARVVFSSEE